MTKFHLIGIGGSGMSVLAEMLAAEGQQVSGSDRSASPVLARLRALGIDARAGHDPRNVPPDAVVVVSSAVRDSNVELAGARRRGQRVIHRSQALALAATGKKMVAVAGTHGKTTTSGMLAVALAEAGADPSFVIGGVVEGVGSGAHLGGGDVFVAEADESDGSFLNYEPAVAIVTNIEADHMDHYGTLENLEQAFWDFAHRVRPGGRLICCAENPGSARLARAVRADVPTLTYGRPERCPQGAPDAIVSQVRVEASGSRASVTLNGVSAALRIGLIGVPNLLNAAAAFTAGAALGIAPADMAAGLGRYRGAERRFEERGAVAGRRLFDDYAHHPTEVAATIAEARVVAGEGRVVVLFQPHLFSRTRAFARAFARALGRADRVVVTGIFAAREDPVPGVDGGLITRHLPGSRYEPDLGAAADLAARLTGPGDVCVTMGAGSVTQAGARILAQWGRP